MAKKTVSALEKEVDAYLARLRSFLLEPSELSARPLRADEQERRELSQFIGDLLELKVPGREQGFGSSMLSAYLVDRRVERLPSPYPIYDNSAPETAEATVARLQTNIRTLIQTTQTCAEELRIHNDMLERAQERALVRRAKFDVFLANYARPHDYEYQFDRPVALYPTEQAANEADHGGREYRGATRMEAIPPLYSDPGHNYAVYRNTVASYSGALLPRRQLIEAASLHVPAD